MESLQPTANSALRAFRALECRSGPRKETEILPTLEPKIMWAWESFEAWRVSWDAQQLQINFRIQAGGSDVLRRAEILVDARLLDGARLLLSNHDEICVSCP